MDAQPGKTRAKRRKRSEMDVALMLFDETVEDMQRPTRRSAKRLRRQGKRAEAELMEQFIQETEEWAEEIRQLIRQRYSRETAS